MSTILKALRHLESDKANPDREPVDPSDASVADLTAPRRRRRGQIWLGAALAVAGVVLLAVALLPGLREQGSAPVVARAPAPAAVRVLDAPPEPAPPLRDPAEVAVVADSEPTGDSSADHPAALVADSEPSEESSADDPAVPAVPVAVTEPVRSVPSPPAVEVARSKAVLDAPASRRVAKPVPQGVVLTNDDLTESNSVSVERARTLLTAEAVGEAEIAPEAEEKTLEAARQPGTPPVAPWDTPEPEPVAVEPVLEPQLRAEPEPTGRTEVVVDTPALRPPLPAPSLGVERTRWHPRPERREARVEIDGMPRVIRQGDEALGYRVVEISPSSVVFGRDGETVRLRVGAR